MKASVEERKYTAGYLLWNGTAFPFANEEHYLEQLRELHEKSGGDVQTAINIADGYES